MIMFDCLTEWISKGKANRKNNGNAYVDEVTQESLEKASFEIDSIYLKTLKNVKNNINQFEQIEQKLESFKKEQFDLKRH